MGKLLQHFLCGTFLLTMTAAYATDCVNCGPKDVSGMPSNSTFDAMEKIVFKAVTDKGEIYKIKNYCMRFAQIPQQLVGATIKEMEGTTISIENYLTEPQCQPRAYSNVVKSPMLHVVAEDPTKREEFLQNIWLYYSKKRKQPEIFNQAINAKNTEGETLLDYIETMRTKGFYSQPAQKVALTKIINMLCSHGGIYATQKNMKCP